MSKANNNNQNNKQSSSTNTEADQQRQQSPSSSPSSSSFVRKPKSSMLLACEVDDVHTVKSKVEKRYRLSTRAYLTKRYEFCSNTFLTALQAAALSNSAHVAQYLISAGADILYRDESGITAFHLACQSGSLDIVKLMCNTCGTEILNDPLITKPHQHTPLHFAAYHRQVEIVQYLLSIGMKPDKQDKKGNTPLMIAVSVNCLPVIKVFMQHARSSYFIKNNANDVSC